uniref:60S ribosomal protein L21 n=1 Tax=Rhizochromulina marina TaxID=1034831 RepID=A0A7S2SVR4_9STRA|mmetsp:Transcript_8674/g.24698  ORF Transcript_8674/g.24698 Transcript_8674/m.24698 type:complete len:168 (+) Transcript_8674:85-588(+)|eukprot:CAMPEP_0118973516 /NCGR_PEP_ID=MMETSP1173-20130426/10334_1 /TAXON_ID=1034831 /ORGANISM="Rhizochromulina marina cf, Strain CCMP1243" /LENGTH=167 /DNA_ID=CAMNT_0006923189 /DNA_START=67 /DNA_END=570 /DNA_ORIENTATION=-
MPHSFGHRARTRDMYSRPFGKNGVNKLSTYLTNFKRGDHVDIKCNPSIHKGMPFKHYHGRTGVVYNVTKRALGVCVNKLVNGRILEKRINIRIEHAVPSKCKAGHNGRVEKNEQIKKAVKEGKIERTLVKRTPIMPRPGYFVSYKDEADEARREPETIQPVPFSDVL